MVKGTCGISLVCITVVYAVLFALLTIANFVVQVGVFYDSAEEALTSRVEALDAANLKYIHAKLEDDIKETKRLNDVHVKAFETGLIDWSIDSPESNNWLAFRKLLHNSISVYSQYQFVTFHYQYMHAVTNTLSWGFSGWFGDSSFFYTNVTGHTGVFNAPGGVVDFNSPLYYFVDGNGGDLTEATWLAPMLASSNGMAWTPIYTYPHEVTGVDLYATYGKRFTHGGNQYTFNLDVNLLYVTKLLANNLAQEGSVAFIIEGNSGALVGSSLAAVADGVTTGGHPDLYTTLPDGSAITVQTHEATHSEISRAAAWLKDKFGSYRQVEAGSYAATLDETDYLISVMWFTEAGGAASAEHRIEWLLVQATERAVYLENLDDSHERTLLISGILTAAFLVVILVSACCLARQCRVVYKPMRCEAAARLLDTGGTQNLPKDESPRAAAVGADASSQRQPVVGSDALAADI